MRRGLQAATRLLKANGALLRLVDVGVGNRGATVASSDCARRQDFRPGGVHLQRINRRASVERRLDLRVQRRHLVAGLLAIRAQARTRARPVNDEIEAANAVQTPEIGSHRAAPQLQVPPVARPRNPQVQNGLRRLAVTRFFLSCYEPANNRIPLHFLVELLGHRAVAQFVADHPPQQRRDPHVVTARS